MKKTDKLFAVCFSVLFFGLFVSCTADFEELGQEVFSKAKETLSSNTVTFMGNGGSFTADSNKQLIAKGETAKLLTAGQLGLKKEGCDFAGWSESEFEAEDKATYKDGDEITLTGNISLYAVWKDKVYDVTFIANGGVFNLDGKEQATAVQSSSKAAFTLKRVDELGLTRKGAVFAGWSLVEKSQCGEYKDGQSVNLKDDITLYAIWK